MKRIFLFLATNLAVILLLTLVINLLGLDSYLDARMGNYVNLLIFAAVIGFGGAFISLAMSKCDGQDVHGRAGHCAARQ